MIDIRTMVDKPRYWLSQMYDNNRFGVPLIINFLFCKFFTVSSSFAGFSLLSLVYYYSGGFANRVTRYYITISQGAY